MEYEISFEGEEVLFDDSTNPSLEHGEDRLAKPQSPKRRQPEPADKRRLQKGELIPEEEEHQLA
jgi:hypothetical protein